ncbi:MAG: hypothetical protein N0A16_00525 [Blastocatellia bacterium]|nr:hypothetical protein [Blastocatellia bacterium]MCS7156196.1 hypothetical protein [Blastocatellia bacterium]MCX7751454.1 hypothetical protein [Blastocatellia bacterium]MDW8169167.1 hypothetical protein [Acidobacteriota bacterium]MDW8256028.1 hypothetical protein [Acidobacteriota bacterium]
MRERNERLKRTPEGFFFAFVLFAIARVGIGLGVRRWLPPLASEHGAGYPPLSAVERRVLSSRP